VALIKNMPSIIGTIVGAIPQLIGGIIGAFGEAVAQMASVGVNIVKGLWKGITGSAGWLIGQIGGFVNDVVGNIGSFFGIHSPSTRMRDEIGQWIPPGIGEGVTENEEKAIKPIRNLGDKIIDEAQKLNVSASLTTDSSFTKTLTPMSFTGSPSVSLGDSMVSAIRQALSDGLFTIADVTARIDSSDMSTMASKVQSAIIDVRDADTKSAALAVQQGVR